MILSTASSILIAVIVVNFGAVIRQSITHHKIRTFEAICLDFLIGAVAKVSLLVVLSKILGFTLACYSLIIIMLFVIVRWRRFKFIFNFDYLLALVMILFFCGLNFQNGSFEDASSLNPLLSHNLLAHSLRAGNISIFIVEHNYIPAINQNLFQSIWAAFMLNFSNSNAIQYCFSFLLGSMWVTAFGIISLTLSFFSKTNTRWYALLCVCLNSSISNTLVNVVDVGSTIFNIRSIDVTLAVCLFLINFIIFHTQVYAKTNSKFVFYYYAISSCFALMLAGPQFLLFQMAYFALLSILNFFKQDIIGSTKQYYGWLLVTAFSLVLPFCFGGFFVIEIFRELPDIPAVGGLMDDPAHIHRRIGFRFPFLYSISNTGCVYLSSIFGSVNKVLLWPEYILQFNIDSLSFTQKALYSLATLRFILIPLLGIIGFGLLVLKKHLIPSKNAFIYFSLLAIISLGSILFVLFVEIQSLSWPVSRFYHPFLILSFVMCSVSFSHLYSHTNKKILKLIYILAALYITHPMFLVLLNRFDQSVFLHPENIHGQFVQDKIANGDY